MDGKVADPEDNFVNLLLTDMPILGLIRTSEMLMDIDVKQSKRIQRGSGGMEKWYPGDIL